VRIAGGETARRRVGREKVRMQERKTVSLKTVWIAGRHIVNLASRETVRKAGRDTLRIAGRKTGTIA
jgi:hypothetical protein